MTTMASALALTLYVGAARSDATADQLERLRTTVLPAMRDYKQTGDEKPVRDAVRAVMGDDWRPSGQWAETLANCADGVDTPR